ncbi:MAG TPA: HDOD domain-containing protein [Chromatiales bacterium]|nr:HDOD domain-containing protein [Chromatiales bacterium]
MPLSTLEKSVNELNMVENQEDEMPIAISARWLGEVSGLVSPPDVYVKVFDLMESPTATADDMGLVISQDPSLTARLLKIVNSPFYNFSSRIDTVSRAIAVIGLRELYSLVVAVSAVKSFSAIPNDVVNMDTFWRHSIYCGIISRLLAKRCHVLHTERLFIAGLLHDIGSLVIYNRVPDIAKKMLESANGDEERLFAVEREELGFTHADLGGELLKQWSLPDSLQEAVAFHHQPGAAKVAAMEAAIVHIANILANQSELGAFCEVKVPETEIDSAAWAAAGLKEASFDRDEIIGEAGIQFVETASLFW